MNMSMTMNDPWEILDDLLGLSSRTLRAVRERAAGRFPPMNVYLGNDAVVVDVELPGKTADEIELTLDAKSVTVANRPRTADGEAGASDVARRSWSRCRELPFAVDAEKASAKFENGILRITLPKAEEAKKTRIAIQ